MKLIEAIENAEKKGIAMGHFNIGNLEQLKAIAHVGVRLNIPIIIGVSEGERAYLGVHHVVDFIKSYNDEHSRDGGFRLFLNADHTHSLDKVREAAEAGFDAILFDGGKLSLEENIAQAKEAVKIVKNIDPSIIVEGELGYIGSSSEILEKLPEGAAIKPEDLTTVEEAKKFVDATGVDMLAPAVGNIHGMFANAPNPRLDIMRVKEIKDAVKIPLVLHGGSGTADEDFTEAINAGISIVHISTELRYIWRKELEIALREHPIEIAPYKVMPEVIKAIEEVVEKRLKLFSKI
ncbi:MAG: class II fructose-bisphosphate aldolase [Candidatus Jorgensenbacteria bacterium]|nr:class II fructose-bisphosphate aldolase [Candidatus Jorgensenbacteria bacterium]